MTNELLNRYKILSTLGEGGMGVVFLAEDTLDGGRVALKVLSQLDGEEAILRFKQEFRTMTRLRHPNTVEVHDFGQTPEGKPYFTMEVVPGQGLDEMLPLSPEALEPVLVQLCHALGFIHGQGLVHCDIKPENIRIREDGVLKLMDFGLMESAGQSGGSIKGTLAYMAPEVCKRGKIDCRADLYSVGALAYHLLTGRPPFEGATPLAVIKSHLDQEPSSLRSLDASIPESLDRLILRLLEKDPSRRPSAQALLAQFGAASDEEQTLLFTSPFIGRQAEYEAVLAGLHETIESQQGRMIWLSGNAGLGKSRLAEEIRFQVQLMDLPHLLGAGYEESAQPYGPFIEILRQALPLARTKCPKLLERHLPVLAHLLPEIEVEKAVPLEPKEEKLRLQAAITELLTGIAFPQGLVLALEDWQWADPNSRELLTYLGRNLDQSPILVFGTSRLGDPLPGTVIPLRPFGVEEASPMLAAVLGEAPSIPFVERLVELTGGNPFTLERSVRHLVSKGSLKRAGGHWQTDIALSVQDLPSSVFDLLREQFERLSSPALELLRICAVIGHHFKLSLLEALRPDGLFDALAELSEAGILAYRDGVYSFAQKQYAEAMIGSLEETQLVALHSKVALALEERSEGLPEEQNELARHFLKSCYPEKAVRYALEAGKANFALFALQEAKTFLEAGYRLLPEGAPETLEYGHTLGDVYRSSSELDKAETMYERALELAGEDNLRACLLTSLGLVFQIASQYDKAKETFERAAVLADAIGNVSEALRAKTSLSRVAYFTGDTGEAIALCEQALALSRQIDDQGYLSLCLGFLGLLYVSTTPDRIPIGLDYLSQSLKIKQALGDKVGLNDSYMLLGNAQLALGRFQDAQLSFEENQRLAREIGNTDEELYAYLNLALVAYERGDFAHSLEQAEIALTEASKSGNTLCEGVSLALKAIDALYLGDLSVGREWIEQGLSIAVETSSKYLEILVLVFQVEWQLLLGQLIKALETANRALELIRETGITEQEGKLGALRAEIFGRLGEAESSEALWQEALAFGQAAQSMGVLCRTTIGLGRHHLSHGHHAKARELAEEALHSAAEIGSNSLLCEAKLLLGDALFHQTVESAAQAYRDAVEIAEGMQCPHWCSIACFRLALTYGRNSDAYLHLMRAQESLNLQLKQLSAEEIEDYLSLEERWCIKQGDLSFQIAPPFAEEAVELSGGSLVRFANMERKYLDALSEVKKLQLQLSETQLANRILENLMRFSREIGRLADLDEVLRAVTTQMVDIIGAERGYLLLEEDGKLKSRVSIEPADSFLPSISYTIANQVLREGQSVYLADAMEAEGFNNRASVVDLQIRTVMCVPIRVKNDIIGVIYVDRQTIRESFSQRDLILAETLASQASAAIENARLYTESRLHARQLEMLNSLAKSVSTTLVMSEVLDLVMSFTLNVTGADRGFILLKDDYTDLLHFHVARDKEGGDLPLTEVKISQSICQRVIEEGDSLCVVDALADSELQMQASIMALNLRTVMCVPLQVKNDVLGVLYVDSQAVVNAFSKQDLDLLRSIASQASVAIENARLYEKATVDGLTKLFFRSYFEARLAAEVRRTLRFGTKLSLMMMDIDHFKKFNDTYGHQTGDEVLKLVARVIREGVRTDLDIPARYGGEEMLVLMPETDSQGAMVLAERLREAIASTDLPGPNGDILHVNVSIGVATLPTHCEDSTALIEKADQALYHSKRNGRNRVTLYSAELSS